MCNLMSLEGRWVAESFPTSQTFVRFLSSMNSFMFFDVTPMGEDLVAVAAGPYTLLTFYAYIKDTYKKKNIRKSVP